MVENKFFDFVGPQVKADANPDYLFGLEVYYLNDNKLIEGYITDEVDDATVLVFTKYDTEISITLPKINLYYKDRLNYDYIQTAGIIEGNIREYSEEFIRHKLQIFRVEKEQQIRYEYHRQQTELEAMFNEIIQSPVKLKNQFSYSGELTNCDEKHYFHKE